MNYDCYTLRMNVSEGHWMVHWLDKKDAPGPGAMDHYKAAPLTKEGIETYCRSLQKLLRVNFPGIRLELVEMPNPDAPRTSVVFEPRNDVERLLVGFENISETITKAVEQRIEEALENTSKKWREKLGKS